MFKHCHGLRIPQGALHLSDVGFIQQQHAKTRLSDTATDGLRKLAFQQHFVEWQRSAVVASRKGELPVFTSRVVLTGKTKIISLIEVRVRGSLAVRGFISFIHVDKDGKPLPHGLDFVPQTEEEKAIHAEASNL